MTIKMNKQHFEFIANILRVHNKRTDMEYQYDGVVLAFMRSLVATNADFNEAKFLEACGIEPKKYGY